MSLPGPGTNFLKFFVFLTTPKYLYHTKHGLSENGILAVGWPWGFSFIKVRNIIIFFILQLNLKPRMLKMLWETPFLIFKLHFGPRGIVRHIFITIIIHVAHPYICKNKNWFLGILGKNTCKILDITFKITLEVFQNIYLVKDMGACGLGVAISVL